MQDTRSADWYDQQYNARAGIPEHATIFTRWQRDSARVRRGHLALLDLHFGEAAEERLDFFPAPHAGAPLLVFIHGGWWRSLDKSDFSFLVPAWLSAGYSVALTNYTLAPAASIAEMVMQQLRGLAWLYRHAEHYEFDRERIAVAGHSAGGHLAAMMLAAHWQVYGADLPADLVKAGVLMSGLYDLDAVRHASFVNRDLKLAPEHVEALSPAGMQLQRHVPFISAVGGEESEEFQRQTRLLGERWKASRAAEVPLPGVNHLTICDEFADPRSPLFRQAKALLDLM